MKPQIIAFYLPQYYPFKENDEWWGKGFTEWTNVGKAKPLFKGHNQPRVPTELGYYDLRLPEVREKQAQLAREAGVTAFCYWHYWFGNGKRLLERVFDEVLESGKPDFPFCLGWSNHSWYAKDWNSDGTSVNKLLIEQRYPGEEDEKMHFDLLLKAFRDPRYVKIEGMPLLYVYRPKDLPIEYVLNFREWVKKAGFPDLFLVAQLSPDDSKLEIAKLGFNAFVVQRVAGSMKPQSYKGQNRINNLYYRIRGFLKNKPPYCFDYSKALRYLITVDDKSNDVFPSIIPQWDHTPRSGRNGTFFFNATPDLFYHHVKDALKAIENKPQSRQILFLKSWNEWGEGNYMEPDITFGRGFCIALKKALDCTNRRCDILK